jgi:hypothetical protein
VTNTNTAATIPVPLVVSAGGTSKAFTVLTSPLTAARVGTVTAQFGGVSKALTLTVRPIRVKTLVLTPNPVVGGASVTGSVVLECGASPGSLVVTLSSSNTALAAPTLTSVTIPGGATTATFNVRTARVTSTASVTIYATANGTRLGKVLSLQP